MQPKIMGPKQNGIDYRVEESVGCESCHGPGLVRENPTKKILSGWVSPVPNVFGSFVYIMSYQQIGSEWDLHFD